MAKPLKIDAWDAALLAGQRAFADTLLGALVARGVFSESDARNVLTTAAERVAIPGEGLGIEPQAYGVAEMFVKLAGAFMRPSGAAGNHPQT